MSKIFLRDTFATLLCASLAAQATKPRRLRPHRRRLHPRRRQAQRGQQQKPQHYRGGLYSAQRLRQRHRRAAGTAGSASSDSGFMLASAMKPAGTTGSSASSAPIASSYKLDAEASKLTPHVGHKVEVSGTVQGSSSSSSSASGSASSSSASAAPTLKVDNVRMIAATCTP